MVKAIALVLLAVALVMPAQAAEDWSAVVDRVLKSVLYVESDDGSCTAFVIDTERKYVMTAAHCDGANIWIDRVKAEIVSKDTKKDLAVFYVKHLSTDHPALKLGSGDPHTGDEVLSVGYGMGLERPIARKAMISDTQMNIPGLNGPFIATDAAFVGGQSGGPIVNNKGEVVMIVQMASGTVGIGVGADTIRQRTGRFWK